MTTLEEIGYSILRSIPTKSVTVNVTNPSSLSNLGDITVAEIVIILAVTGNIVVNGVTFVATAGVPYTFKYVNLRNVSVTGSGAGAIYYPAFNQFPEITPNN